MLDCHEYLAKRGWKGKGTALRSGGIAKPINVTQKRTLSGLGKDRDEAFPFWEHVYDASISAVNIKVHDSDTDSEGEEQQKINPTDAALKRTSTGIISNRRPTTGVAASSTVTPTSRLNILGNAKRSLAQRQLYSRFYRGPVITDSELDSQPTSGTSTPSSALPKSPLFDASFTSPAAGTFTTPVTPPAAHESSEKQKAVHNDGDASERAARREARRVRREQKLQRRAAREVRRSARATPSNPEPVSNNVASLGDGAFTKPNATNVNGSQLGVTSCPLPPEDEGGKREKKKKRRKAQ